MSRYTVDMDKLAGFAGLLDRFDARAVEIARGIEQQITALYEEWLGVGADANRDFHTRWLAEAAKMREAVSDLRKAAEVAHRNYTGLAELNAGMWP